MSEATTRSATTSPDLLTSLDPLLREWLVSPEAPTPESRRAAKACWFVLETQLVKWIDDNTA